MKTILETGDIIKKLTKAEMIQLLLSYEISSSWWASSIGVNWMQDLSASYFAWKLVRKYRRFQSNNHFIEKFGDVMESNV